MRLIATSVTITLNNSLVTNLNEAYKSTRQLNKGIKNTSDNLKKLEKMKIAPVIKLKDRAAQQLGHIKTKAENLGKKVFSPTIAAKDNASGIISNIRGKIGELKKQAGAIVISGITEGFKASISGAAEMEKEKITMQSLMGDENKTDQLFAAMGKKGLQSSFSEKEFLMGAKSFLPMTKNLEQLDQLAGIQERMALSDENEGMEGAASAIREVLSGNTMAIADSFGIPESMLEDAFKGAGTVEQRIAALDKVLNQMGYTQQFVTDVNKSASAQWESLKTNISAAVAKMGAKGLEQLKPVLEKLNGIFSNEEFMDNLINKVSEVIARVIGAGVKLITWFETNWPVIKDTISSVWAVAGPILEDAAAGIEKLGKWAAENKEIIIPVIAGICTSFLIFGEIIPKILALKDMLTVLGIAIGSITWPMVAVAAAVAAVVLAWRNWDKIVEFTEKVKEKLLDKFNQIKQGIADKITGMVNSIKDFGKNMITKIAEGIKKSPAGLIIKAFKAVLPDWVIDTIGKLLAGEKSTTKAKSFASGFSYVPYDNYPALLHRGERVLTAAQNRQYGRGKTIPNITIEKLADRIDAGNPADVDTLLNKVEERIIQTWLNMPETA